MAPAKKWFETTDPDALAEALAQRCKNAQQGNDGWMVCCPAHDDTTPSLHITPSDDRVLLRCFAGCSAADVVTALGLTMADLFLAKPEKLPKPVRKRKQLGRIAAVYDYHDISGTLLFQTVRYDPKDFRQRRPDPLNPHNFIWNLEDISLVVYHLNDVLDGIENAETIYLVEGEKDADALREKGLIATCNPLGAGKWDATYTATFHNADVVLLPDNDVPGRRHVELVAQSLYGTAHTIKVVHGLHTEKVGSDVSDWIAAGGTRQEFEAIIADTALYTGPAPIPIGFAANGMSAAPTTGEIGVAWRKELFQKKNGELTQNYFNVAQILKHHEYWQDHRHALWFDVAKQRHMVGETVLIKAQLVSIAEWFGRQERLPITNLDLLKDCLHAQCEATPRDTLQHWINSLPGWDNIPRLETWLCMTVGAKDEAYTRDIARILPVGMIARALDPGCIFRYVVILKGEENIGKSELVRTLASPEWYYAMHNDFESKEAHMEIQGAWVAELPELDSLNRTSETRLKAFITLRTDAWIPKHANDRISVERRTVFIGTTNDESFLKGQTGNTRFVPLTTENITLEYLREHRLQLFAEAKAYYLAHPDDWWQFSPEGHARLEAERELHRQANPYEDLLQRWLLTPVSEAYPPRLRTWTTWEEIANDVLQIPTPERWKDKALQMEIARAMRALKWRHTKRIVNKGDPQKWVYEAPANWGVPF